MRRRSNASHEPSLPSSDDPRSNDDCSNNRYRKRLRSWKQRSSRPEPTPSSHASSLLDSSTNSRRKSTIYTYPIDMNGENPRRQSSTMLSRSLTSESAFFSPSVPCHYIPSGNYLNNNYVPAQNKRKMSVASSCESLSSRLSPTRSTELNQTQQRPVDVDQRRFSCTCFRTSCEASTSTVVGPTSPAKRSRLSSEDLLIPHRRLHACSSQGDQRTIDINESDDQVSVSTSKNNPFARSYLNPMDAAVKMVQPIVDIIFNAFEDQLRSTSTNSLPSATPPRSSFTRYPSHAVYPFYSSAAIPFCLSTSLAHPVTLHAVNFNIPLTRDEDTIRECSLIKTTSDQEDLSTSLSIDNVRQEIVSSNSSIADHELNASTDEQRQEHRLARIIQVAIVGVSVMCGYWLL